MTEDMLDQHASLLLDLGSTNDAALLRAKIQSASLLSDMESFKAANPGCILEDFIRWYSPRDLIEIEETSAPHMANEENSQEVASEKRNMKFELSARMKMPGNIWMDAWSQAKPVAARRQRRLFDDTKEAEKVRVHSISLVEFAQSSFIHLVFPLQPKDIRVAELAHRLPSN